MSEGAAMMGTVWLVAMMGCTPDDEDTDPTQPPPTEETGTTPPEPTADTAGTQETGRPRHTGVDATGHTAVLQDTATGSTGDTATTASTADTGAPVHTADTGPPPVVFDCNTIPLDVVSERQIPAARGYHDLAFDPEGWMLGINQGLDLVRADSTGSQQLVKPNLGWIQQMVWLPDGDLAIAHETDGILRMASTGGTVTIDPNIRPYGLILGPDGMLYAADYHSDGLYRVDPTTGASEVLYGPNSLKRGRPRVIAFNLDYTKLYIGSFLGTRGRIYVADLDATYTPTGPPEVFARGVGSGAYHDAIGVDICGYLYVPDYTASKLYRITPAGVVQELWSSGWYGSTYPHGIEWGTGRDGWDELAIYTPQPYNNHKVMELNLGVPSRHWTGGVAINLP